MLQQGWGCGNNACVSLCVWVLGDDAWMLQLLPRTKTQGRKWQGLACLATCSACERCNRPTPLSWRAGQACKQQEDIVDSPMNSAFLHWHNYVSVVEQHKEKPSHSDRSHKLARVPVQIRLPKSKTSGGGWDVCPAQLLRHFSMSLQWPVCVCRCLPPHAFLIAVDEMHVLTETTPQNDFSEA